jgi:TP901 family phage tail tape measure protein
MSKNSSKQTTTFEIDIRGISKIKAAQSSLKEGSAAFQNVAAYIAMLQTMQEEIKTLISGGYLDSAKKFTAEMNKAILDLNKTISESSVVSARGKGYSGVSAYRRKDQVRIARQASVSLQDSDRIMANFSGDRHLAKINVARELIPDQIAAQERYNNEVEKGTAALTKDRAEWDSHVTSVNRANKEYEEYNTQLKQLIKDETVLNDIQARRELLKKRELSFSSTGNEIKDIRLKKDLLREQARLIKEEMSFAQKSITRKTTTPEEALEIQKVVDTLAHKKRTIEENIKALNIESIKRQEINAQIAKDEQERKKIESEERKITAEIAKQEKYRLEINQLMKDSISIRDLDGVEFANKTEQLKAEEKILGNVLALRKREREEAGKNIRGTLEEVQAGKEKYRIALESEATAKRELSAKTLQRKEEEKASSERQRTNKQIISSLIKEKAARDKINASSIKTDKANKSMLGSLKESVKHFFSVEKAISRISFVLTAKLSYDIMNFFTRLPKQAFNVWKEFQSEISKTFALITRESETTKNRLSRDIVELSRQYGIAAKEIASALYEIISAQVPLQDVTRVLEQSIKLAIGGGGDLQTAARSLVQIANAYGEGFGQVARISDVAFQTVKYGQLTMQQYTEEMQKVISTASIFKISQEEISAAISTMTINGIGATQAFTALNQMLMQIANPTQRATSLMQQLGISLTIRDIREKGLGYALEELLPLLNATDQAGRELISILFKSRTGFKAVASILQNLDEYGENYMRMLDSAGATQEAFSERSKNVEMALNRMKTSWDALLMSLTSGNNSEIIGVFDTLRKTIDLLAKNITILIAAVTLLGVRLGVMGLSKIVHGAITGMKALHTATKVAILSMKGMGAQAKALSATMTATWAKVTLGISLVVEAIVALGFVFARMAKNAKDKALDIVFGINEAKAEIVETKAEVEKLNAEMSKISSVIKMANAYEQLAKKQNKSNQEIERMNKLWGKVTKIMAESGIEFKKTSNSILNAANAITALNNRMAEIKKLSASRDIELAALDVITSARERPVKTKKGDEEYIAIMDRLRAQGDYADYTPRAEPEIRQRVNLAQGQQQFVRNVEQVRELMREGSTAGAVQVAERYLKDYDKYFKNYVKMLEETDDKKNIENIESTLETLKNAQSVMTSILKLGYDQQLSNIDLDEVVDTGKPSEKSFLSQTSSILSSMFGEIIYKDVESLRESIKKRVQDIRDEMKSHKVIVTDQKETDALLKQIENMSNIDLFVQLISEGDKAISTFLASAKSFRKAGDTESYDKYMELANNAFESYNEAIQGISELSVDEIVSRTGAKPEDVENTIRELKKAAVENVYKLLAGYKGVFTTEEYANIVFRTLGIPKPETLGDVDKLIESLVDQDQEELSAAASLIKETMLNGFRDSLNIMFGIFEPSDVYKIAEETLKKALEDTPNATKEQINEIIDKIVAEAKTTGKPLTDREIEKLRGDDTATEGFDWKGVLGVADYETAGDAQIDVAKKTVSALQDIWSFYWNWEIERLQKQHQRKIDEMNAQKSIMLANTNMSEEQKALIEEKYAEKQRVLQEKLDQEMAKRKKKQAIFEATIDYAKGLIGLWSAELSKGFLGLATAPVLSAMLSGIFAAQIAMIQKQKFAKGGLTGSGYGSPDETGYRPAGIVHEGELVIDKKTLDRNYNQLTGMYSTLRSGGSFNDYVSKYISGKQMPKLNPSSSGSFASGGLVGAIGSFGSIEINLNGARVLDPIELNKIVEIGGRKRRRLNA